MEKAANDFERAGLYFDKAATNVWTLSPVNSPIPIQEVTEGQSGGCCMNSQALQQSESENSMPHK